VNPTNRNRLLIGLVIALGLLWLLNPVAAGEQLTYDQFREAVEDGRVESVTFTGQAIDGEFARQGGDESDPGGFTATLPPATVIGQDGIEQFLQDNEDGHN
jgi:hypothetical protein